MIFVPLLHYFKCKNTYSGNEYGLRYRLTPGKRSVPDPEGGEGAVKEESILTVDYWPDPWTLEMTDPALRRQEIFPLTDEGRAAAARARCAVCAASEASGSEERITSMRGASTARTPFAGNEWSHYRPWPLARQQHVDSRGRS